MTIWNLVGLMIGMIIGHIFGLYLADKTKGWF